MLHFDEQFNVNIRLYNLKRFSKKIYGLDTAHNYELVEIDMANRCMDTISLFEENPKKTSSPSKYNSNSSFRQNKNSNQIIYAKHLNTNFGKGYYFVFSDRILFENQKIVCDTNSKAKFEGNNQSTLQNYGNLHGIEDTLCFVKYHLNYQKYSINLLKEGQEKKIVQLFDENISGVKLLNEKNKILYQTEKRMIGLIHGQKYNKNITIRESGLLLYDDNYSYTAQYQKQHMRTEYCIRGYTDRSFGAQKNNYSFEFKTGSKNFPIRIDSFKYDILVGTENAIKIFDIRKLVSPYHQEGRKGISDFLYDPNLQKIYVSTLSGLYLYKYA